MLRWFAGYPAILSQLDIFHATWCAETCVQQLHISLCV